MAEACKRLIKNCIICWNYLYLSQKLAQIDDPAKREELLQAIAHGSAAAWGHLNLLGEYDFCEEVKFQQRYQMRHRNSRSEDLCRGVASAVYEPVGSTPSPPHSLSGGMIALNHPDRSVR
jgi:Tn3 transposase DDE domain-containing protein